MKLSRLYSNRNDVFRTIDFVEGLNIVFGKITSDGVNQSDSHNLGKTTLCQLIDFCLLSKIGDKSFIKKAENQLKGFVFFLEIELAKESYLTIRRSVDNPSKISLKLASVSKKDFSTTPEADWSHWEVSFNLGKELINTYLRWEIPLAFSYRSYLMYLLRNQNEYGNVFEIDRYSARQSIWKPVLSQMLGLEWEAQKQLLNQAQMKEGLEGKLAFTQSIVQQPSYPSEKECDDAIIQIDSELSQLSSSLRDISVSAVESVVRDSSLPNLEKRISGLQDQVFRLKKKLKLINASLKQKFIGPNLNIESVFRETNLVFPNQVKESFESLVAFNREVFNERKLYLNKVRSEFETSLNQKSIELERFRAEYERLTDALDMHSVSELAASSLTKVASLQKKRMFYINAKAMHKSNNSIKKEYDARRKAMPELKEIIMASCDDLILPTNSTYAAVQDAFNEFISNVINKQSRIDVSSNSQGNYEFKVQILNDLGDETCESDGNTYKKLLCIAFDVALIRSHLNIRYPHFVFHDGVFEAVDDKCKVDLMNQISIACSKGMQYIVTMIDSDLPFGKSLDDFLAGRGEVVLELSDEDDRGLLFKGIRW